MDKAVKAKLDNYPPHVREHILNMRRLIFKVVRENRLEEFRETLKWGELAYITKEGSTLRLDWKAKTPQRFSLYVNCQTRLVETFRELYGDELAFYGKREMIFEFTNDLPVEILEDCILKTLQYHKVKHLPLLGG